MEFLINFVKLTRPLSNIKNIALVLVALYLFGGKKDLLPIILGIISLSFICSAVYAQNSFYDYRADKSNKNKQHYSKAVEYFGKKNTTIIIVSLVSVGLVIGFFINVYFLTALFFLFSTGFFYSSKNFRFKEKIIWDILFGAVFTFFLRFLAAWFIFSGYPLGRLPPLFAISALVFAKTGGYLLYKEADRAFLEKLDIRNSITSLKKKTVIFLSILCQSIAILSFVFMCLNSKFFRLNFLGILPMKFLFLIPFAAPPLMVIYLSALGKIKTKIKNLRILGFAYWALVIIVVILLF
ncbi:MAG: UbiA family prenyltransferase [bacterium]|nr:UbiA family prenyltransferase [bacterium]